MSTTELPAFTTSAAMILLWIKAFRKLDTEELEWFAKGASAQLREDTYNLKKVVEGLGTLVKSDSVFSQFTDAHEVSGLLFNVATQVDAMSALAEIADDAHHLARKASEGVKHG
jgi:ABC-type long-subunit fatty acid transport system fused permease/ATPase subunit